MLLVATLSACRTGAREAPGSDRAPAALGARLEQMTWLEAERRLGPETIVMIPLGAAAKEHGPHLTLANDRILAEHWTAKVLERADVVVAPTLTYHFYPAFVEYPGSTTLRLETARDVVLDVVRSLAAFGPRRFYVLNTGISTVRALEPAAAQLAREGILLAYTDLKCLEPVEREICQQELGSHADEGETSLMLHMAPETVDMSLAVKDASPRGTGGLTRDASDGVKTYSPSGVWGDPTLATRAKGERLCAALVEACVADIARLRRAPLPARID
jgi:creatinine amidohydrolase